MNTPFQPDCEPPPTPEPRDISLQADALSTPDMKAGQFAPWVPAPADAGAARIGQLHAGVDAQGGADPKNEDPEALGPVQNVITETRRLYPPGGLLARRSIGASTIDDFQRPASTEVLLPPPTLSIDATYSGRGPTNSTPIASCHPRRSATALPTCHPGFAVAPGSENISP